MERDKFIFLLVAIKCNSLTGFEYCDPTAFRIRSFTICTPGIRMGETIHVHGKFAGKNRTEMPRSDTKLYNGVIRSDGVE